METRVHPSLKDILSMTPASNLEDIEIARNTMRENHRNKKIVMHSSISICDRMIPGPEGEPDIRVRIYEPKEKDNVLPGLLWIHGGGYVKGFPEMDDALCQRFVLEANCLVISVDYRLAPENPFPAPVEDCYQALKWVSENVTELGVNPKRIAVGGASAGGGLTAAVSLLARDRKGPSIMFQMPLYPMIDDTNTTPSSYEITDERVWNRKKNLKAWSHYLSNIKGEVPAYAAPTRAKDFSELPPTYTCIGDLDAFRDETINYVTKLSQAGVPVEFHLYPGGYHAFETLSTEIEFCRRAETEYVQALKHAFKN